jgi:hypothetical protein
MKAGSATRAKAWYHLRVARVSLLVQSELCTSFQRPNDLSMPALEGRRVVFLGPITLGVVGPTRATTAREKWCGKNNSSSASILLPHQTWIQARLKGLDPDEIATRLGCAARKLDVNRQIWLENSP